MEEILVFILSIFFGAFFFILVMMCCLRFLAYLKDEDRKHLCFKRKEADIRRRRIQLSLLPEVLHRTENLGYTAAPDENIDQYTICQPYVYEDGRSTGMRMIANLPIAIAFTTQSGIPTDSIFAAFPPIPLSPRPATNRTQADDGFEEPPPPDYAEAQFQDKNEKNDDFIEEPPPPSYDECMKSSHNEVGDNSQLHI